MGLPRPIIAALRRRAALAVAVLGAGFLASPALGQSATGANGDGPGAARAAPSERGGFSYGGSFTGRMNLLGPSDSGEVRPPTLPAPPPGFGTPQGALGGRGRDAVDPDLFDGLKLPNLNPNAPAGKPAAPTTTIPATPQPAPPTTTPVLAAPVAKQALSLAALFAERGGRIPNGVKWRVFTDQPDANGEHALVAESTDAAPRFELDPGGYVVHAVYGLVSVAHYVAVQPTGPKAEDLVLPAGAVRLTALVGDVKIPPERIAFTFTREDQGLTRTVAENVRPGTLLRLPAGTYHVVSAYGDANAIVEVDLKVDAGKLVEAQVHHRAALIALKLVAEPGGPALADTSWTVLTPGGDVIRESIGALPAIVLSEGDYTAIARRDGRTFQHDFAVRAGFDASVEALAR